jgi:Tfp pilus assembly protein PilP
MLSTLCLAGGLLAATAAARAQQAPPQPPAERPAQPQAAQPAPAPASPYSYTADGRRDPFLSLLNRGTDQRGVGARPPGLPGLLILEVTIKGILRDQRGFMAMVQGPDNKTYYIRSGDRLADGTVKAITATEVVFSQDVNDPLSLMKQREIRKSLRPTEEGRG